jgi:hypothetical protein
MKLFESINCLQALSMVTEKNLGVKAGYAVAMNINRLTEVVKPFEEERNKLVQSLQEKHGDKDGKIDEKEAAKAEKKIQELLNEDTDVKVVKIKLSDIPDDADLTPSFFALCGELIEE